jgi:hypothetical protein
MKLLKDLMKKKHESVLLLLLLVYIVFDVQTPNVLSEYINNMYGTIAILVGALYIMSTVNPILGVIGLFAAYELIQRSAGKTLSSAMHKFVPSERKKDNQMKALNNFPVTLEEEVVADMAPLVKHPGKGLNYKPASENTHNASDLN